MQGKLEITFCLIQTMAPVAFYESGGSWWFPVAPGGPRDSPRWHPGGPPVLPGGPRWTPVAPRWPPGGAPVDPGVLICDTLGNFGSHFGPVGLDFRTPFLEDC